MSKLKTEFPEFFRDKLTESDLKDNIIVIDTNYLLDMLRLPVVEANKYLKALNKFSKNIYIPYLVALEFNFNKIKVKTDTSDFVHEYKKSIKKELNELEKSINNLSLLKSEAMKKQFTQTIVKKVEIFREDLLQEVDSQINQSFNSKDLYENVIKAIEDKIGDRYEQSWIDEIEEEGKIRYEKQLPPGYDDQSKENKSRIYNNLEYHEKFGDLIIWKDIINKAKESQQGSKIIYVTNDGTSSKKNDLMFKHNGKTIGPDIYLINEAKKETGKDLYILNNFRFAELSEALTNDELKELELLFNNSYKKQSNLIKDNFDEINQKNKRYYSYFNSKMTLKNKITMKLKDLQIRIDILYAEDAIDFEEIIKLENEIALLESELKFIEEEEQQFIDNNKDLDTLF